MSAGERSRDVFEHIEGYEKPPLPPLPAVDDYVALERHGFVELTPATKKIIGTALRTIGYPAFHDELPQRVEQLLRSTNMRESKVFGPAYSATVALRDDPRGALDPIVRAATLAVAARSLCDDVMTGRLPPDQLRGESLEMGQYPNLFATGVVVEDGKPRLYKSKKLDQLAVIVRRRIYTLDLGAAGAASVAQVAEALRVIVARADREPPVRDDEAPGALSAGDSKTVARAFGALERSPSDARSLAALRDSFVVLCLDLDSKPPTDADAAFEVHAANPANRWYLASLQLVVFGNGKAGGICSFPAYLDGNVMMRAAAELQRRAATAPLTDQTARPALPAATALGWKLDRKLVLRAWRDVRSIQEPGRATFEISGIGRADFEARHVDAVNAFVLALAIATKRCAGELPNILQLVTVSRFRCVPVGGAVVTTPEVRRFVDAVVSGDGAAAHFEAAMSSEARECRAERRVLSLRWPIEGFLRTRHGLARVLAHGVTLATAAALASVGGLTKDRIILSHPEIFPEVALLGRPGVRLPYVSHYGLHYQMFADRIVMTFMPGAKWRIQNADFARAIETALHEVAAIAS